MKYLCMIALVLFSLTAVHQTAVAQELSKKERKRLKKEQKQRLKELKKMSAEDFQKIQKVQNELKETSANLEGQISNLKSQLNNKDAALKQLQDQVRRLENELQQANSAAETSPEQHIPLSDKYNEGLVFRVQIGAFRNKNLEQYLHTSTNFSGETNEQGLQVYTLGNFRDYWEADKFKKYVRAMGVRDAWIVPFRDGGRVALKEVLENLQKQQQANW